MFQQEGLINARVDLDAVRNTLLEDMEFALRFSAPDVYAKYPESPVEQFHCDTLRDLLDTSVSHLALCLPRGHAKTFTMKIAVALGLAFKLTDFVMYISYTADHAANYVRDIIKIIESPNFKAVFGPVTKYETRREGEGFFVFEWQGRTCVLMARGAEQMVRGIQIANLRPDWLVIDDLETQDVVSSPKIRETIATWVYGTVFKATDGFRTRISWLGNLLSEHSILYDITHNSPLWKARVYSAIQPNGQSLWPALWPLHKIYEDYQEYARKGPKYIALWFAEMLNVIITGKGVLLDYSRVTWGNQLLPGDPSIEMTCVTIDPATGVVGGDDAAIVVHGFVNGRWQSVDYRYGNFGPEKTVAIAIELAFMWRSRIIFYEAVAFQKVLGMLLNAALMHRGITGITTEPLTTQRRAKEARIMAWVALVYKGIYALSRGDIHVIAQAANYKLGHDKNRDDLLDAHAAIVEIMQVYMDLLIEAQERAVTGDEISRQPRLSGESAI